MGFVKLSNLPNPPKLRVSSVQNMKGGLNIHDLAWQIKADQSPEMKNMWWRDGVLQSRPGLTVYNNGMIVPTEETSETKLNYLRSYGYPYHGWYIIHDPVGSRFLAIAERNLQYSIPVGDSASAGLTFTVDRPDGTFFLHGDTLYYKSKGGYYEITLSEVSDTNYSDLKLPVAKNVKGYIPTTYINAKPNNRTVDESSGTFFGGGDAYQPVNRISPWRCITYNVSTEADARSLFIPEAVVDEEPSAADADDFSVNYQCITLEYLGSDGRWVEMRIPWVYYNSVRTWIYFGRGAPSSDATRLYDALEFAGTLGKTNNVRVTYMAADDKYTAGIMDCNIAEVYGGGQGLCVVMAGCGVQPNAYFWSGNTDVAMDPTYFPVENYNLAGNVSDPITAFGKQQNMLVIFQERQVGRTVFGTTEIDGRVFVTMDYTVINPQMGCDVPNSVQLIENNLVFANTRSGVMFIKDTSSAYENNIVNISLNVEAPRHAPGILLDINEAPRAVTSIDDGKRYWLCANDHVWLWDYSLGGSINDPKALSWYYFDAVKTPSAWVGLDREIPAYIDELGYLREFKTTVEDTDDVKGVNFEKVLALPIQDFGTYEVLKNVEKTIFVVKSSGDSTTNIEYETDYGTRTDKTPIKTYGAKAWLPRDLTKGRALVFTKFAVTEVRKPRCLHVRHFLVRLVNDRRNEAISFISAQIYFTLQGVDR